MHGQPILTLFVHCLLPQVLGRGEGSVPRKCVGYGFFDMVR